MRQPSPVRSSILEIAVALLDELGEAGIRTSQIADLAGVSVPALYHHFGNREGLIEEAQAERFIRALRFDAVTFRDAIKACSTREDLETALHDLFTSRDSDERTLERWKRLNALGATYARPDLAHRITRVHNELVTEIALAMLPLQRMGVVRQDIDLRAVVSWYNGAVLGKNLAQIPGSDIDVTQWERTMNEAIFAVLFGHQATQTTAVTK